MITRVLNVGHGLCVHLKSEDSDFVFDCGTHGRAGTTRVPRAWKALSHSLRRSDGHVDTIAVSHLHWDHYCGFLEPIAGISHEVKVVLPRIPTLEGDTTLRERLLVALLSMAPLDPSLGPLDIDLMRRIRRYAPGATPVPVSAGASFTTSGDDWEVLWPPRSISANTRGLTKIEKAVSAYEEAAERSPEMRRRLEDVRESETFRDLLADIERKDYSETDGELGTTHQRAVDATQADKRRTKDPEPLDGPASSDSEEDILQSDLVRAGREVRNAANDLSLVLLSRTSRILLTGDATKYAVTQALGARAHDFNLVVTPHHGGHNHVPAVFTSTSSLHYASSAGGSIARQIGTEYDALGAHHRTDRHSSAAYLFDGDTMNAAPFEWLERW